MAPFSSLKQTAPDRLEIREGGGCMAVFGLPFLAGGVFVTLIGARIVPVQNAAEVPGWLWPLLVLMGLAFVAVGGGLVFGRRWIILDAGGGVIVKAWGLLVPLRREEHSLRDYDAVVVRFQGGDSDTSDRYPVSVRAQVGGADLPLTSGTDYGESRESAASIARFLHLPLVDAVTDHESVTAPDHVDETLQERLRRGEEPETVSRPLRMRAQVQESGSSVRVVIPGPGFSYWALPALAIPVGILTVLAPQLVEFFERTRTPGIVQLVFLGFLAFVLGVLPALHLISAVARAVRGRTVVQASADGITIEVHEAWRTQERRIAATEILGLDYSTADAALKLARHAAAPPGQAEPQPPFRTGRGSESPRWMVVLGKLVKSKGITVKGKSGLVTFGAGLPDDELRYLQAAITRVLRGPGSSTW